MIITATAEIEILCDHCNEPLKATGEDNIARGVTTIYVESCKCQLNVKGE